MLSINSEMLNSLSNSTVQLVENKYIYTGLVLLIILYASLIGPKLPLGITKYMDNAFFRAAMFFLITYLVSKDKCVALLVTIAFVVTIQQINANKLFENLEITPSSPMTAANSNDVVSVAVPANAMPTADNLLPVDQQVPANQVATMQAVDANPVVSADANAPLGNNANTVVPIIPNNNNVNQVVMDQNNNPVKDANDKVVVAAPTVVTDKMGNPITDASGNAVLVAPKTAVTDGQTAVDNNGQVIVAPPQVVTDANGKPQTDKNGNMVVKHCEVKVNEDNQVYMINADGQNYYAYQTSNPYDNKNVMDRQVEQVCNGPNCFNGYTPKSFMNSNLCEGANCYGGLENKEYANY